LGTKLQTKHKIQKIDIEPTGYLNLLYQFFEKNIVKFDSLHAAHLPNFTKCQEIVKNVQNCDYSIDPF
jgi:hypothetical protein